MSTYAKIEDLTKSLNNVKIAIRSLNIPTAFLDRLEGSGEFTFEDLLCELGLNIDRHTRKNAFKRIRNNFKHLMDDPVWINKFHYNSSYTPQPMNPTSIDFTPKGYVKAISIFDNTELGQEYANISAELFCLYSQTVTIRERLLPLYEHQLKYLSNGTDLCFWAHMTELCALNNRLSPTFNPWNHNANSLQKLRHMGSVMGFVKRIGAGKPWAYTSQDGKTWAIEQFQNLTLLPKSPSPPPSSSRSSTLL